MRKDVATLMLETGARPDEIFRLKLEKVNINDGCLSIPFGKTKAARRKLPLSSRKRRAGKACS